MRSPILANLGFGLAVLAGIGLAQPSTATVNIEWVTVGDPGNPADTADGDKHTPGVQGYGAVAYVYKIARTETTISQYAEFLNAVAKTDTYNLFDTRMSSYGPVAGINRSGSSGTYSYSVVDGRGNKPISYVSWFDAARFCNWMHNGQPSGLQNTGTTEDGVYSLKGATTGVSFNKNMGATFWIPSEDEWYKAAYYDPTKGGSNYWLYPTRTDTKPNNHIGYAHNANFFTGIYAGTESGSYPPSNALTEVGIYGADSASHYGTSDQGGNVYEWNDAVIFSKRGIRGGSWYSMADALVSSYRQYIDPYGHSDTVGFRVACVAEPNATSLPASAISGTSATLNGSVNANGGATTVSFQYGLTDRYGSVVGAVPASVTGTSIIMVNATLSGLLPGTVYHFRVVATNFAGTTSGADMTFTAGNNNANLAAISLGTGTLVPGFDKLTTSYIATVPPATTSITVTPTTEQPAAAVQVNGTPIGSGTASAAISLPVGTTTITVRVTAEDTVTTKTYLITITRLPDNFVFNSASDVPVTANGFATGGYPVNVVLNYAPDPNTILTMVDNTALGFIDGTFANLAQGQRVTLTFNGVGYDFVANYYGGTGNDLVLQWAATQVVAWGSNSYGQLGDATTTRRLLPTPVDATGMLAGKTVVAVAKGYLHSLALCSDGTLAAWGYNVYGQLGNNSATPSSVPVAVDRSGVLAGRTVIAVAAGPFHNLALCSDGSVVAWGYNNYGQLGTGGTLTSRVPVLASPSGALTGKQVVAVAAGVYHSFALCADGTVAAWGFNDDGELGNGSTANSSVPAAVDTSGVLAGKQVASLSTGQYHTLALCTDGTLLAWGYNNHGQLGNNSTASSSTPVAVGGFGALAGKTLASIRTGGSHSLALCADGTLSAWGWNNHGQLGVSGIPQSTIPVLIDMTSVNTGTTLAQVAAGGNHSLALCANGTLAAWGDNASGQLGNNSLAPSVVPVMVDVSGLSAGAHGMMLASDSAAQHNLAVFGLPSGTATPHAAGLQTLTAISPGQDAASSLIDYAFGLHLDPNNTGQLPQGKLVDGNYVIAFTQPAGVTGTTYGAECSATLLPGSWTDVPDTGTGSEHIFNVPRRGDGKLFMRLKVTGLLSD